MHIIEKRKKNTEWLNYGSDISSRSALSLYVFILIIFVTFHSLRYSDTAHGCKCVINAYE